MQPRLGDQAERLRYFMSLVRYSRVRRRMRERVWPRGSVAVVRRARARTLPSRFRPGACAARQFIRRDVRVFSFRPSGESVREAGQAPESHTEGRI